MNCGIINVNKPSGLTSFSVIRGIGRELGKSVRVGHAGTLDPSARGVLIVLVDGATKTSQFFTNQEKEYEAEMVLGVTTNTHDMDGEIIARSEHRVSRAEVEGAFNRFKGRHKQVPPMASAKRYKGQRLYNIFRRGGTVPRKAEEVEIKSLNIKSFDYPEVSFRIVCSKGTYIRTLCHDIGDYLGCGAYLSSLIRLRIGKFVLKDSIEYNGCGSYKDHIIPIDEVMCDYPHLIVSRDMARDIRNGRQISNSEVLNIESVKRHCLNREYPDIFPVFNKFNRLFALARLVRNSSSGNDFEFKLLRVLQ